MFASVRAMNRALLVTLSLFAAASCGESEIVPATGSWDFVEGTLVENSCGEMLSISSGLFELVNNDDGTFTIDPQDSEVSFDCNLDGAAFECPERVQSSFVANMALIDIRLSESGTFSSNTAASGRRSGTASCEGEGCSAVGTLLGASFPCTAVVEFTTTFEE